jgi:hypothetical protein
MREEIQEKKVLDPIDNQKIMDGDQQTIKNLIKTYHFPKKTIDASLKKVSPDFIGIYISYLLEDLSIENINTIYERGNQIVKNSILDKCPNELFDRNKPKVSDDKGDE